MCFLVCKCDECFDRKKNINTVIFNWYNKSLKMLHTKQDLIKCLKLLKLVVKIPGPKMKQIF